jgi:hypothetical protein
VSPEPPAALTESAVLVQVPAAEPAVSCPRRWETQPESNNSGGPAPDVEYATRPAGVLQYMILGLTGPG